MILRVSNLTSSCTLTRLRLHHGEIMVRRARVFVRRFRHADRQASCHPQSLAQESNAVRIEDYAAPHDRGNPKTAINESYTPIFQKMLSC